jgi:outer membrane protein assembly factor BamD (BamD/ComL family)
MIGSNAPFRSERRTSNVQRSAPTAGSLRLALMLCCAAFCGCKSPLDNVDIKDVYGPAGRQAKNNLIEQAKNEVKGDPAVGLDEFEAAHKLYENQKYPEARKAFHAIVKKYKKKKEPIVNDALFFRAECDFQLGRLADAQDGYDELLKNDQSTKYLEQAVRRLYAIGRYWLNMGKPASEIEMASFTDESGEERLKELPDANLPYQFPLTPNFTDKTRPLFDTQGRALQALKSVHLHDVSGPLADDALMTLATYHLRKKDYREADQDFKTIREQCPKSEFVPAAYVLGAHASLMSYQGARYDGKQLEEARKLTEAAVRLYPNLPQRAKLERDLKRISAEAAERDWARVEYYQKRGENKAVAVHCETIIERYPDSPRAAEAREVLLKLGKENAANILKTPLFPKEPSRPVESEAPYDEPEEPARVRVSDGEPKADERKAESTAD